MTLRIGMWSGPRNISTAMMRAWENRQDCTVWDEPLYGHYLHMSGIDHPGKAEIIADQGSDWRPIVEACITSAPEDAPVFYQKQMTHHLLDAMDWDWLGQLHNIFLIRNPEEVLASYRRVRATATLDDLGIVQQARIYDHVVGMQGEPMVLDAKDVLMNPEGALRTVCAALGINFDPNMLSWPAGKRASDGIWGPYWYDNVWQSTGFEGYRPRNVTTPPEYREIMDVCMAHYERLRGLRLDAS